MLEKARNASYDVIILDAFNSDSVPVHLMTKEALSLYLSKLKKGGLIAFNISNNHLDFEAVVAGIAKENNSISLIKADKTMAVNSKEMIFPSKWAVVFTASDAKSLKAKFKDWHLAKGNIVWTDNYSSIIPILDISVFD